MYRAYDSEKSHIPSDYIFESDMDYEDADERIDFGNTSEKAQK